MRSHLLALLVLAAAATAQPGVDGPQPATGDWVELPTLPIAVSNNATAMVRGPGDQRTFYSFMGIRDPDQTSTITAASYSITLPGGSWRRIADAPRLGGLAKIAANAITVAGEVYLLGGYTAAAGEVTEPRLFRYDVPTDSYVRLADVPTEVDDTVVGVYRNRYVYLISGWHGPRGTNVANVQLYDTQTNGWSQATPIPGPLPGLFGHTGGLVGDELIYMDGAKIQAGFRINDRAFVGKIDPRGVGALNEIAWREVPAHPGRPTYRAAGSPGAVPGQRFLLHGGTDNPYNISGIGYNGQPSRPLAQTLLYHPASDNWETVATRHTPPATMDHRAMVGAGRFWARIGGMTEPGVTTARCFMLVLDP
ncbi:MAG: kelch repeat-containing protein [Planctomycetota bacterium]